MGRVSDPGKKAPEVDHESWIGTSVAGMNFKIMYKAEIGRDLRRADYKSGQSRKADATKSTACKQAKFVGKQ